MAIFLKGSISNNLEPFVEGIGILDRRGNRIAFDAILDTGFNDELVLPNHLARRADLSPIGTTEYQMADGSWARDTVYLGKLSIGGRVIPVRLSLTASRVGLLGMRLLVKRTATFNLRRMTVLVED